MSSEDSANRFAYFDLLAATLTEHEKKLDTLIEKLDDMVNKIGDGATKERPKVPIQKSSSEERPPEVLTYMKIEIARPIHEIIKILETLAKK